MSDLDRELLTIEQTAELLQFKEEYIRKLCRIGLLPAKKFSIDGKCKGNQWRIFKPAILDMFTGGTLDLAHKLGEKQRYLETQEKKIKQWYATVKEREAKVEVAEQELSRRIDTFEQQQQRAYTAIINRQRRV